MLHRPFAVFLVFFALLFALHAPVFAAVPTIVKSNVRVLNALSQAQSVNGKSVGVRIAETAPGRLKLSGAVPSLKAGDVIVSGEGRGLLRKVLAVGKNPDGSSAVQTAQGTLTDVFQQADIKLKKRLTAADLGPVQPLVPGVRVLSNPTVNSRTLGVAQRATGNAGLNFEFANLSISTPGDNAQAGVKINGTLSIDVGLDIDLNIRREGFKPKLTNSHVLFTLHPNADVTVTGEAHITVTKKVHIASILAAAPITVWVGFVPVVFAPVVDIYCVFDGTLEIGAETKFALSPIYTLGKYQDANEVWQSKNEITNATPTVTPTLYTSLSFAYTPIRIENSLLIYGVAGPFAAVELPKNTITVKRETDKWKITDEVAFTGEAGAKFTRNAQNAPLLAAGMNECSGVAAGKSVLVRIAMWH